MLQTEKTVLEDGTKLLLEREVITGAELRAILDKT